MAHLGGKVASGTPTGGSQHWSVAGHASGSPLIVSTGAYLGINMAHCEQEQTGCDSSKASLEQHGWKSATYIFWAVDPPSSPSFLCKDGWVTLFDAIYVSVAPSLDSIKLQICIAFVTLRDSAIRRLYVWRLVSSFPIYVKIPFHTLSPMYHLPYQFIFCCRGMHNVSNGQPSLECRSLACIIALPFL